MREEAEAWRREHLTYAAFSSVVRETPAQAPGQFAEGSIDVLHVHGRAGRDLFDSELKAWLSRLSSSGLVLLDDTAAPTQAEPASARLFGQLQDKYPSFEFRHGGGVGVVGVGTKLVRRVSELLAASHQEFVQHEVRTCYRTLGEALLERRWRHELDQRCRAQEHDVGRLTVELLKEREAMAALHSDKGWLAHELDRSREQANASFEQIAVLERDRSYLIEILREIERSLGWALMQKARSARTRLLGTNTIGVRSRRLFSAFVRTAIASGLTVAVNKSVTKITRRLQASKCHDAESAESVGSVEKPSAERFLALRWRYPAGHNRLSSKGTGHFKVVLVAHSACRTGAPLCLLRVASELARLPDFDCWVVLRQGGDLAPQFASVAPTLELSQLAALGVSPAHAPDFIAKAFREFADRGLAICNTVAVSKFCESFARENVAVLSWIHELGTFIDQLGGASAIEAVKAAAQQIMVPAEAVRTLLIDRYGTSREQVLTIYNGINLRTEGLSRDAMRRAVRDELGLSHDALIVLGCGTVDLRKGADLFVATARRFLGNREAESLAAKTWFVWVGACDDSNLERWLLHDACLGGLEGRILFIGSRADTAPTSWRPTSSHSHRARTPARWLIRKRWRAGWRSSLLTALAAHPRSWVVPASPCRTSTLTPWQPRFAACWPNRRGAEKWVSAGRCWSEATLPGLGSWTTSCRSCNRTTIIARRCRSRCRSSCLTIAMPRFSKSRLRSIFEQTLSPHEIIFLDDASPDESVEIARRLAPSAPAPMRIVVNDENSGSTFRQWTKGIAQASGDLIWIAESDDSCHPNFLERLVPEFYDPDVALAYCQSMLIGPDGQKQADDFLGHTDDLSTTRWRKWYSVHGVEEATLALSQKNTIPNASAVVFRKPAQLDFMTEINTMRFAGDWLFYSMLLQSGKIAYTPAVLNYYRRHDQTVTHHSVRGDAYAAESLYVKARVFETFPVPANAIARSLGQSIAEYNQLTERLKLERSTLTDTAAAAPRARSNPRRRGGTTPRGPRHSRSWSSSTT